MSYFSVFQVSTKPLTKEQKSEFYDNVAYSEDANLANHSDYLGDVRPYRERIDAIKRLKEVFAGIADIDARRGTMKVLDAETIRKAIRAERKELLTKHLAALEGKDNAVFDSMRLRLDVQDFRRSPSMFCLDGASSETSMQFVENLPYLAGQTLYLGTVIEAHY